MLPLPQTSPLTPHQRPVPTKPPGARVLGRKSLIFAPVWVLAAEVYCLGEQRAPQEHFLLGRELPREADVEGDEEVAPAPGLLGQRHPLAGHHLAIFGAAEQRRGGLRSSCSPNLPSQSPRCFRASR